MKHIPVAPMAHLNYSQRIQIAELIREGKSNAQIAHALGVHRSTIGREIQRHAESREKYVAHIAQLGYLRRRTEAVAHRYNFGGGVRLFSTLEKRNKVYTFLNKSHTAFFIPSNYLRMEWSNDLLYSGPMDSHIYSVSRVPDYRLSNIICLEATGVILPYEKKSGEKYIFRPGQSQGLSNPIKKAEQLEVKPTPNYQVKNDREEKISSERDWLSVAPHIKQGGKKDLLSVSPRIKHGGKKDCMVDDLLDVSPRVKHGVKKDCIEEDEAEKRVAFLCILLMYEIHFTHPYFLIGIVPSPPRPSYSYISLALFPSKIFQILSPKKFLIQKS